MSRVVEYLLEFDLFKVDVNELACD